MALVVGIVVSPDGERSQEKNGGGAVPAQGDRVLDEVDAGGGVDSRHPNLHQKEVSQRRCGWRDNRPP